jgi:urease accessory protein
MNRASDWLILQLADSAFPVGGFAHSGGLEAAVQHGQIDGIESLCQFLREGLWQTGHASLPLVAAVHDDRSRLRELDALCDAFLTSAVANRASRTQGRAFLSTCERVFDEALSKVLRKESRYLHHAPCFGAVLSCLRVPREETLRLFLFLTLRGLLSAAVRLGQIGPQQAQKLQLQMEPTLESVYARCLNLAAEEIAQTAPLVDLFQSTHDRLYSRLFIS